MSVIVYYTSVSSSNQVKKQQQSIFFYLDSKKIPYKAVDISQNEEDKDDMRSKVGNPTALPPQICNGDTYCGDYEMFFEARENEEVDTFLKL